MEKEERIERVARKRERVQRKKERIKSNVEYPSLAGKYRGSIRRYLRVYIARSRHPV